jgi:hypothetical protein
MTNRLQVFFFFTLREYFTVSEKWTYKHNNDVFKNMTNRLQGEAMAWCYRDMIQQVPEFEDTDDLFVANIASRFKLVVYPPQEFVYSEGDPATHILFVNKGLVRMLDRNGMTTTRVRDGGYFGDDCLLTLTRQLTAQSIAFSCLLTVFEQDFKAVTEQYPAVKARLRRAGLRLMIRRFLMLPKEDREVLLYGRTPEENTKVDTVQERGVLLDDTKSGGKARDGNASAAAPQSHRPQSSPRPKPALPDSSGHVLDEKASVSRALVHQEAKQYAAGSTDEIHDDLIATIHAQDEQLEVLQGFWDQDMQSLRADISALRNDLLTHMSNLHCILESTDESSNGASPIQAN